MKYCSSPWLVRLVASTLALALVGCFPLRFVTRPGISGVVLDDTTSRPVVSATVTLRMSGEEGDVLSTTTDARGAFLLPAKHFWHIYFVGMDFVSLFGVASFDAPGFVEASRRIASSGGGPSEVRLGDVRLTRAQ
jgi:hypothetical protein